MSEAASREWRIYIDDMIEFAEKVVRYTSGLDQQSFVANEPYGHRDEVLHIGLPAQLPIPVAGMH